MWAGTGQAMDFVILFEVQTGTIHDADTENILLIGFHPAFCLFGLPGKPPTGLGCRF